MTAPAASPAKGALFALLAFASFSAHDAVVKLLGGSYAPVQVVFFTVFFGFPIMTIALLRDRTDANLIPRHPWWTALRTGSAVLTGLCVFYAFSVLPLAEVYAILFMMPLLITLLAVPVLGERVGWRRGIAVLVGLGGVFIVLDPAGSALGLGHAAALSAAVFGSVASIVVRKIGAEERSVVLMLYPMVANAVLMGALLPFVYEPMPIEHLGAFLATACLGLLGAVLVIQAYRRAPAVIVAPMQYSQIIWAVLIGAVFFGETVENNVLYGAAIVIASGIYIVLREATLGVSIMSPILRAFHLRPDTGQQPRIGVMVGMTPDQTPAPRENGLEKQGGGV
ncbi:MAG: DMT family transporter [Pseudomonadota bacterium]